ncbi:MAG: ABC transporter ATP-binding protein [Ruminococcaceae bacterium]|nr:ABC transporter ATP-binding protein [Oscillospiraceae bacterium]
MNALELRGLQKNYGDFMLGPLDLTLPAGCIMGLVGENGAGKTTTIKLILDMISRDGGTVSLYGKDAKESYPLGKEEIGVVLDEVGFSACLNALEVGKIMRGVYRNWDQAVYEGYLRRFELPEKKKFKDYSLGMKKKLGIAAALSHNARLLVLDEPTGGLDPVVRDEVVDIFSEFTRDESHAVLISSHIVSDLEKLCDYIAFLHRGKLMLCEEKDELCEEYGVARCSLEDFAAIEPSAVLGKRETPYGIEALLRRADAPAGMELGRIDIEDLFVLMVKEAK